MNEDPVIGRQAYDNIQRAFQEAADSAQKGRARRERKVEDLYYGDVPTFMELPLAHQPSDLEGVDVAILGVGYEGITIKTPWLSAPPTVTRPPLDAGYWRMGSDQAPDAIRRSSLFYSAHHNRGIFPEIHPDLPIFDRLAVVDYGNVPVVPENTKETMDRITARVSEIVHAGAVPVILGGDHTIPFPTLRAVLEPRDQKVGLISFDSHLDLSATPDVWASSEWAHSLALGKIDPANFVQIGIRSNRSTQFELQVARNLGIRIFTIDEIKSRGMAAVMDEALEIVSRDTYGTYLSLDIDVMDPFMIPGQKAPEIWGLTVDEIMVALRQAARTDLIGYDICEMTPDYDINGISAQFCARTVVEVLAGLAMRDTTDPPSHPSS